jgi:predicted nucleic acid-binding protein
MLIVADTSALVALAAYDALSILGELFRDVHVPSAVFRECTVPGKPWVGRLEAYLIQKVVEVDLQEFVIVAEGLGQGELEAMALCKRLRAERLLIDDYRARKVAHLNGIHVVGSLGVLLLAKEAGLISQARPLIAEIQAAGVRYSDQLVAEVLRLAGE